MTAASAHPSPHVDYGFLYLLGWAKSLAVPPSWQGNLLPPLSREKKALCRLCVPGIILAVKTWETAGLVSILSLPQWWGQIGSLSSQSPRPCSSCLERKELPSHSNQSSGYITRPDLPKSRNTKVRVANLSQLAQNSPGFGTESLSFWESPQSPAHLDIDMLEGPYPTFLPIHGSQEVPKPTASGYRPVFTALHIS